MISKKLLRWFLALTAVAIVGTALVWGFWIVGSPYAARLQKFDELRLDDLRAIHGAVQRMVVANSGRSVGLKRALPSTIEEVADYVRTEQHQNGLNLHDPQTSELYVYRVRDRSKYELGATFSLPRDSKQGMFWNHPAGPHLFVFDAVLDEPKRLAGPLTFGE